MRRPARVARPLVRVRAGAVAALLASVAPAVAHAQNASNIDPHVSVVATARPTPSIRLTWPTVPGTLSYVIKRRDNPRSSFLPVTTPAQSVNATGWTDATAQPGHAYEYAITRTLLASPVSLMGNAYVLAGIEVPFRDDQGVVVLVIDQTMAPALAMELDRLESDLTADGWTVARELVAPTDAPPAVRARIVAQARTHGRRMRAVFLLGGVPRAFSGLIDPDGRADHVGAWPADGYYGEVMNEWLDNSVSGGVGPFANTPGDGRFDASFYPGNITIAVGRVDPTDMPAFAGMDAVALLRRYLDKDHAFRTGAVDVPRRTFVSDLCDVGVSDTYARAAWRDSAAVFGTEPDTGRAFFDALEDPTGGYAIAFGCGPGTPTSADGVATTMDFVTRTPRAVFVPLFGMYFPDWSYQDNLLRAAILGPGTVLATTSFARPNGHYHGLGAMQSLGDVFLTTQNNAMPGDYDPGESSFMVHQALLGDPTLRLFVTRPPTDATATPGPYGVELRWTASSANVAGYHVYRAVAGSMGAAERLTSMPTPATRYTDAFVTAGMRYVYRVVAVELITTGSGMFYNHSPGVFVEATAAPLVADPDRDAAVGMDGGTRRTMDGCGCRAVDRRADGARHAGFWSAIALASIARRRRPRR